MSSLVWTLPNGQSTARWAVPTGGAAELPVGGTTGEVLTKLSDADGDAGWEAGGGSQPILSATRAFTSAEILSLQTVPIEIVPAPGAGYVLVPIELTWVYRFGTTPYDTDGVVEVNWDGDTSGLISVNGALFRSVDCFSSSGGDSEARKPLTICEDLGLVIDLQSPVVDGDGTGTATVYYIKQALA